jgi:hypothetical protein
VNPLTRLSLLLTLVCLAATANATPLHALRTAAPCGACHVSPAGGGLRNGAGARYAAVDLPTFVLVDSTPRRPPSRPTWVSLGGDAELAFVSPAGPIDFVPDAEAALSLAVRPYNPRGHREGRVTLIATPAFEQDAETLQVRDYSVLYDDLMLDLAVQAGRFVPSFGERFPGDRTLPVTGAELSVRPGPVAVHVAGYRPAPHWDAPFDADAGWGTQLDVTWQPRGGRLGLSGAMLGGEPGRRFVGALHGGFDLGAPFGVPLIYLGEYDLDRGPGTSGASTLALRAQHLVEWRMRPPVALSASYAWADPDTELRFDSRHEALAEVRWDAITHADVRVQYLHAWQYPEDRFRAREDTLTVRLHGGF